MLIAIPTEQGRLAGHFGRCREVSLFRVDPTSRRIEDETTLEMPPHQPGVFPAWLRNQGVEVVIAGGMGPKALTLFAQHDIQVLIGADAQEPRELVIRFLGGELSDGANTCTHGPSHHCEQDSETVR
jgi:predicted Fe-Mo cluster-binding NifX family protein